ncbi:hypothetical protein M408DRAFT_325580 [Serendipita vermifera MAFF 305830]|uniref:Uncharacterized protein n=1 Tax=Serendipita vermifera MAFF 305830 TaxID=933852 RepID=A0A0C2XYX2_SERVB|nr:hypothetical protein M408DRAFT_325580 [Serendipita vermifera MAFF 305830]
MSLVRARKLAFLLQTQRNAHLNQIIGSGAVYGRLLGKPYIPVARQLHTSMPTASKKQLKDKPLKVKIAGQYTLREKDPLRAVPPRYVHGPTLPGLRVVVKALETSNTAVDTKEIWDIIQKNGLGAEYTFPTPPPLKNPKLISLEPTNPTHPVRSLRYLKTVLLATLEANGRVRKVHSLRPPSEEEETAALEQKQARIQRRDDRKKANGLDPSGKIPIGVDSWQWELVPPREGTTPVEQRRSIPMSKADTIWMDSLDAETRRQVGGESTGITRYQGGANAHGKEGGRDASGARAKPQSPEVERRLAERLAQRWQIPILKDEASSARAGVVPITDWKNVTSEKYSSKKVDWNLTDKEKQEKLLRRKDLLSAAPSSLYTSTADWSQKDDNGPPVKEAVPSKEGDLFGDGTSLESPAIPKKAPIPTQLRRGKPHLNPLEPEYRQSRRGINDIPIALEDPRRRQFGFHYGLPKQKELLRAANARDYDQKEWTVESQPPPDFSHLSSRRQKTREEQNAATIHLLKRKNRNQSASRKLPITPPVGRVKWGLQKEASL